MTGMIDRDPVRYDPERSETKWPKMEMSKIEFRLLRWTLFTVVVKHWRDK